MSSNGTNITNASVNIYVYGVKTVYNVYYTCGIFFTVVGTLLNLWFLVAILSSRDMRSRLRNKIICNSLVLHLVDSALVIPVNVGRHLSRQYYGCVFHSVFANIRLIQDFIGNWLLVMIIIVFIAQIQDFNPRTRLTPRVVTLATVGLLAFPWIASLIVVPVIIHDYYSRSPWASSDCFIPTWDSYQVFKSIDTAVPVLLTVVLVIVAAVLRYRRFTRGFSTESMKAELICRGPEIDTIFPYVTAVVVSTFCDLLQVITNLRLYMFGKHGILTWYAIDATKVILSDSRVVFMPLPWLLLPDVRQRIRTWRPWYRPAPGIDLTFTYNKEET